MKRWIGICVLLLSGCMSIPISTLVKMASFDREAFLALEPEAIAMRITLDKPAPLDLSETRLEFTAVMTDGMERLFPGSVEQQDYRQFEVDAGWFSRGTEPRYQYFLVLDEQGQEAIRTFQRLLAEEDVVSGQFRVNLQPSKALKEPMTATMELQFDQQSGFFTLLDEATIDPKDYLDPDEEEAD
ncbi:hypothetical protein [Ferrimonas pelagia]|uniref:Lipoprotein n=1 Tax=Ferrimonas pelagia TaxID=1177826 RepID=A0ABP9EWA8_9GAMM